MVNRQANLQLSFINEVGLVCNCPSFCEVLISIYMYLYANQTNCSIRSIIHLTLFQGCPLRHQELLVVLWNQQETNLCWYQLYTSAGQLSWNHTDVRSAEFWEGLRYGSAISWHLEGFPGILTFWSPDFPVAYMWMKFNAMSTKC